MRPPKQIIEDLVQVIKAARSANGVLYSKLVDGVLSEAEDYIKNVEARESQFKQSLTGDYVKL